MILFLIIFLVPLLISLLYILTDNSNYLKFISIIQSTTVCLSVSFIINFFISLVYSNHCDKIHTGVYEESYKIISIVDNIGSVQGTFKLGFGSINTNPSYYFLMERDSGFIMSRAYADNTILYEGEDQPMYIKRYDTFINKPNSFIWVSNDTIRKRLDDLLILPLNTIKVNYNIDLND